MKIVNTARYATATTNAGAYAFLCNVAQAEFMYAPTLPACLSTGARAAIRTCTPFFPIGEARRRHAERA